jgi:hypothetical protein
MQRAMPKCPPRFIALLRFNRSLGRYSSVNRTNLTDPFDQLASLIHTFGLIVLYGLIFSSR